MSTNGLRCVFLAAGLALPVHAVEISADMPAELRRSLTEALFFLEAIQGGAAIESPLHRELFGEIRGADYIAFIDSNVREIIPGECDAPPKGCKVLARTYGPDQIQVTPSFSRVDVARRAAVLLHEARHFSLPDHGGHVACPTPFLDEEGRDIVNVLTREPLAGLDVCDAGANGSYGLEYVFLTNFARGCSNCSKEIKSKARFWAEQAFYRINDEEARTALRQD